MNAHVEIEQVDPKKAQHYLARLMDGQRPVRDGHVLRLATEAENGTFRLTGDALIFVKGKLANGQHRLHAAILADRTLPFLVLHTDDEEIYKVLDSGIGRTAGDALHSMGLTLAKEIAAVAFMVVRYDRGCLTTFGQNASKTNKITRSMIVDYVEEHQKPLEKEVFECVGLNNAKRICAPTLTGTLLHIANRTGRGDCRTFLNNLYLGGTQDAAFDLRERLIRNKDSKYKLRREHIFGLLIKAYRSFVNGTRPGTLKFVEGEEFPKIP